jgi:nucleoside-diphosphate-sugar epimerase
MHALILGGTGFVGPAVVEHLAAVGHRVTLFHGGHSEQDTPPGVEHVHSDRAYLAGHAPALRRLAPDVVVDMRPLAEHDAQDAVATFRSVAGRLVVVSSGDVYRAYGRLHGTEPGPPEPLPLAEDAPLRERLYPYRAAAPRGADDPLHWVDDYDKILVERAARGALDLPATVLRLPMVYGPRDDQHRLAAYLRRMDDGRPALLLDERLAAWRTTRGYVDDVGAAIALAATSPAAAGRTYNVGEAEALTEVEWIRAIAAVVGWDGRIVPCPGEQLPPHLRFPGWPAQSLVMDTTRLRRELGYAERVPRSAALARTIAWERDHPPPSPDHRADEYAAEDVVLARLATTWSPARAPA